jgi:hypothetical protein
VTPRRTPARLLVRALAVVGGAFVLVLLGAAAAGAAESHVAVAVEHGPTTPAPPTVSVPVPEVVAPILRPVALSVAVLGGRVDIGGQGVDVTLDAPVTVPALPSGPTTPALPTLPSLPDAPVPTSTPTGAGSAAPTTGSPARTLATHAPPPTLATVRAVDRAPTPAPSAPGPATPLTVALAAIALGLQVSTRHGGPDDAGVTSTYPHALRRLVAVGRAALARGLDPRPEFHLLLARPG